MSDFSAPGMEGYVQDENLARQKLPAGEGLDFSGTARQKLPDYGPPRAQDNPAHNFEASTAFDVRCRSCGKVAVRVAKGDSLDGLEKAAGQHDCPLMLAPGHWLAVAEETYQAYRDWAGSVPWASLSTEQRSRWLDIATAAARGYLKRKK